MASVWPAEQWWIDVQRAVPAAQSLLPGPRAWQRGATRCRVERDGDKQDGEALKRQFEEAIQQGMHVFWSNTLSNRSGIGKVAE